MKEPLEDLKQLLQHTSPITPKRRIIKDDGLQNITKESIEPLPETRTIQYVTPRSKFLSTLFAISLVFFLAVFGYMVYSYKFADSVISNRKIVTKLETPSDIVSGKETNVIISISNNNKLSLQNAELVTLVTEVYKDNQKKQTNLNEKEYRIPLGTIESKKIIEQKVPIFLIGSQGQAFTVTSKIEYSLPDSVARFKKLITTEDVIITKNPLLLSILAIPAQQLENQEFGGKISLTNNDSQSFDQLALRVSIPQGVTFTLDEKTPFEDTYIYPLDEVASRSTQNFSFKSTISPKAPQEVAYTVELVTLSQIGSKEVSSILSRQTSVIRKKIPFMSVSLESQKSIITVLPSRQISTNLVVRNTSMQDLQDVEITLKTDGSVVSRSTLESDSGSTTGDGILVFNRFTDEDLVRIPIGQSITLPVTFMSEAIIDNGILTENPESIFTATISATSPSLEKMLLSNYQVGKVQGQTMAELYAEVVPSSKGTYAESGSFPMVVGGSTGLLAKLTLRNSSNALEDALVTFKLPYYVAYSKNQSSAESVQFNEVTRTVTWNVGKLDSGAGLTEGGDRTITILLTITPTVSQANQIIPITSEITLSGKDSLTGKNLSVKRPSLEPRFPELPDERLKVLKR